MKNFKTFIIFIFLITFLGTSVYVLFVEALFPVQKLYQLHAQLLAFHKEHKVLSPLLFIFIYIIYAILSLPGIFILSLIAGYLFGQPYSTLYVVFAATMGATILFWILKTGFKDVFFKKAKPFLKKLESGFNQHAASYLLFLRWIPLFPFPIVNIAAAIFKVPFFTFLWTTIIGMIPSVYIYTKAGIGFNQLIDLSPTISPLDVFNSDLIIASVGLCLFSLLPILVEKFRFKYFNE